jgi:hypothetical protein
MDMDNIHIGNQQPDDLKELLIARWIRKAYSIGDPTALEFNEGKPFLNTQTYDWKEE